VIDDMSLDASTPQLAEAAHRGPSLRAALAGRPAPAPGPVFASTRGGMNTLVDALIDAFARRGGTALTGSRVDAIEPDGRGWRVAHAGGEIAADAAVVALPPTPAANLLAPIATDAASTVATIGSASVVLVTLAHRVDDVPAAMVGSGFLVPRTERDLRITAASWFTSKWAQLARDDGITILRVSLGHAGDPAAIELDDADVVATVARDLAVTMGIDADATDVRISRWRDGFPQFGVGHLDRIDRLEMTLAASTPTLAVAGAMMRGVGIPACIRQGRAAARRVTDL
jgi:oxygen-dependent protoporphyrinogen oxidase